MPTRAKYKTLKTISFLHTERLSLENAYYRPHKKNEETLDAFIYEISTHTTTVLQAAVSSTHSVKPGGFKWLRSLAVKILRYVAIVPAGTELDPPFPNNGPPIAEKYVMLVKE